MNGTRAEDPRGHPHRAAGLGRARAHPRSAGRDGVGLEDGPAGATAECGPDARLLLRSFAERAVPGEVSDSVATIRRVYFVGFARPCPGSWCTRTVSRAPAGSCWRDRVSVQVRKRERFSVENSKYSALRFLFRDCRHFILFFFKKK